MAPGILRRPLRRALEQVRHVAPVQPGAARGTVAAVYAQVERDFGMLAPPVALHSPAPGPLAASWVMLRETLVAAGIAERADKEAAAAAVSRANRCPYCVAVHGATLGALSSPAAAAAVADGRWGRVGDPGRERIARWAAGEAPAPPLAPGALAELTGVVLTFHYLNRMVNVFLGDGPLPARVPRRAHGPMMRLLGRLAGAAARGGPPPGAALPLLPPAPPPPDLAWAADAPPVADALARAAAAVEAGAAGAVPGPVRELVRARLRAWDGRPPGLDRGWAARAAADLAPDERPAARLALLTALASYQVGPADIAEWRRERAGDRELIEITAWTSLTAARRIAQGMPAGSGTSRGPLI
ncbi:carboxymuconolactone decarboxylase family protein [Actinomadura darangshiensis]|uniref:Carboxymuconolactone decarboxylase family protein n=1 Tax=Actinomadura darangshiensis TaxID=705336 RepID=A0A4R5A2L9_9ACTN|nr:carboxymuconolactone decarboxylase family protein [Actinomadura darangshiensis]TDD64799.1 carboxymuconolactone decarboxylase family protein [Actinomadura darangshiensis]